MSRTDLLALPPRRPRRPVRLWLRRYIRPLGPLTLLCIAAVGAALSLSSCSDGNIPLVSSPAPPPPETPRRLAGLPTVRVKIGGPTASAAVSASGPYRLLVDGKQISESGRPLAETVISRSGGRFQIGARVDQATVVDLVPLDSSIYVSTGGTTYRGLLRLIAQDDSSFIIVNHVDLESYLAGVLPKELYPSWSPQTYHALAVAARTFAYYNIKTIGPRSDFDLGAGEASQMYGGFSAETAKSWQAVRDTHGQIMVIIDDGKERLFLAQYSSACGGVVNGAYVIRNAPRNAALDGGQVCNDCSAAPRYRWSPVTISKADIHSAVLAAYPQQAGVLGGGVKGIRIYDQTPWGRAVWLDLIGASGQPLRLRAEDLRLALLRGPSPEGRNLFSMNCTIRDAGNYIEFSGGHGYGHGVGLCQWGAEGKARAGWEWKKILGFYYPHSRLMTLY
jgi:stage II sporulation protein D